MDTLLAQLSDVYLQNLIAYTKVLQQRNSYLKSVADNRSRDTSLLDVYDHQLLKHGSYIFIARENFFKRLSCGSDQVLQANCSIRRKGGGFL